MKRRGVIRRVVLPSLWLLIGLAVAASLVKLAFLGSVASVGDDQVSPTGQAPSDLVQAEVGTVRNTLTVDGTIELDPARSAVADAEGVLVYAAVREGDVVAAGDRLFQILSETWPETVPGTEPAVDDGETGGATRGPRGGEQQPPAPEPTPIRTYTDVFAPVAGAVGGLTVAVGDDVAKGTVLASVQPKTFKAVGSITPLDRYRLIDRPGRATITIKGGPKPFTCTRLSIGDAAAATAPASDETGGMEPMGGTGGGEDGAATTITCVVPGEVTVFDGLTMSMRIRAGSATDVLVVPVTAVRGLLGSGSVWVVGEDGLEAERPVSLGVTDGKVVAVTSGLEAGETLLRYVPGSGAHQDDEMMRGGEGW